MYLVILYILYIIIAIERTRSLEREFPSESGLQRSSYIHMQSPMFWCCCIKVPTGQSGQPQLQAAFSNVFFKGEALHTKQPTRDTGFALERRLEMWKSKGGFGEIFWEIFQNLEYFKVDRKVGCRWLRKYPAHLQTNLHYQ